MTAARQILEDYVRDGQLLQVATLRPDGSPVVCNVWYDAHFAPDVLRFISRHDREHSANIRAHHQVAGSIIAITLEGLGQRVRGVTFAGTAREMAIRGIDAQIQAFVTRWPVAAEAIDPGRLACGETATRLYEVRVDQWILFDEINFPDQPRQPMQALHSAAEPDPL